MEKKYLEVSLNGHKFGAFENVTRFIERPDMIYICSDDGCFDFHKGEDGIWRSEDNNIEFDDYNYCGRRALNRHVPANQRVHVNPTEITDDTTLEEATEDEEIDFKDLFDEKELEYDDLDIEVEETMGHDYWDYRTDSPSDDYQDVTGTINSWTYYVEPSENALASFLGKDFKDITQADVDGIDEDKWLDFLHDWYEEEAIEDAKENYGPDDVDWGDDYDYEPEPDYPED